jgi:AhpD family alkylhydroperoxidase
MSRPRGARATDERARRSTAGTDVGFRKLHREATGEGALGTKEKELIALGIAISAGCDGCVAFHVHDSLRAGASREEISEAIGVAVLMGGGPAAVYGSQALSALTQFEEAGQGPGREQTG